MKEKILAISYFLPPYLTPQSIQIGRLLLQSKYDIVAVSGNDCNEIYDYNLYSDFSNRIFKHLIVHNRYILPGIAHKIGIKFFSIYSSYPDCYKWWIDSAYEKIVLEAKKGNIKKVITFGQPMSDHILGLKLKEKFNFNWIAHFSDPWVDNPFRTCGKNIDKYKFAMEKKVMINADKLIFTSLETAELVMKKYSGEYSKKIHILQHSYDKTLYSQDKKLHDKKIIVRYIGNLYGNRSPEPLFKALELLIKEKFKELANVQFEIIGEVSPRMLLSSTYKRLPKELVYIKPNVDYITSLDLMRKSDILLIIDAPSDNSPFFPSKLADYIGAGVFMAGITSRGTSQRILSTFGCPVADPENIKEIAEMIKKILTSQCHKEFKINVEVQKEYDISKVAERFDTIIASSESIEL